ncbi:hypothetical protein GCK72_019926 [Caenorhabditis remanei]|uniref:Uncharacterized protein n=1 Tax=Caenorhabditis remanei TaxID=31234 RepID=A0A6A5GE60_CAERE|nr:hypothetical protein GCK72_019926 [Caenorhabditis remanei]KAF1753370.1 hypothetical protein GCK72_019926 [Caenorhabditis remanei]
MRTNCINVIMIGIGIQDLAVMGNVVFCNIIHKPDNTTRMVILMTIASVIAEGPIGLAYLLQGVSGDSEGLLLLGGDLISVFEMFVAMNSLSHCLISLIVSTPYQNTVKDVFKCLQKTKKIGNNVTVTPKISVTTVASVSHVIIRDR